MQFFPLSCGQLEFDRRLFFPECSTSERMVIPVAAYLINHPCGNVLFDTGVHPQALVDSLGRLGQRIANNYKYHATEDENIVSQLALLGLAPADISYVINSHLHFDHCGGNEFFPQSIFLVQRREMEHVRKESDPHKIKNIAHPGQYQLIDGQYNIFGDGKLQLIPTYGHSPGHQSLLMVTDSAKKLLLAADACYTREHLDGNILPTTIWDGAAAIETMVSLRRFEERDGVLLFFGHENDQSQQRGHDPLILSGA